MRSSATRKMAVTAQTVPDEFYTDLPVGEILRRARLARGMPIDQAERQLHIRAGHLAALERSDFDALPGRVYVIGFIRTYAEFLGLDGDRVVHLLKRQSQGLGTPQSLNMHYLPSDTRLPSVPILAAAAAAILILLSIWIAYQSVRIGMAGDVPPVPADVQSLSALEKKVAVAQDPATTIPAAQPVPAALKEVIDRASATIPNTGSLSPAVQSSNMTPVLIQTQGLAPASLPITLPPEENKPLPLTIHVREDSWIELRSPQGRVIEARVFRAGEDIPLDNPVDKDGHAYHLSVGNAGGVQVIVNGKSMPPLGADAQVRRNISLDPAEF